MVCIHFETCSTASAFGRSGGGGTLGLGGGGGGSQGVKSEAARLIAAVVKNSKSKEVGDISHSQSTNRPSL